MNFKEILTVVEQVLLSRELSTVERLVFCQSWMSKTYTQIAQDSAYGNDYIKEVGYKLWKDLSEALGERVTKKNLRLVFKQYQQNRTGKFNSKVPPLLPRVKGEGESLSLVPKTEIEFPGRPLPLDSPLYINRPPIEELAAAEIHKPGCVLRIKAPRKMGKSSFVNRIIACATTRGYKTVFLDFQEADTAIFASLDKFLRWLCANASKQLQLPSRLDDYWDEEIGSKISCKLYFERYLLEELNTPLVLTLNDVNHIFKYPEIVRDFLPMLRTWHEQATQVETWQKLRLLIVQSTEVYVSLNLTQSPFNVGLALKLPEFSLQQVQDLALRYGFTWAEGEVGMQRLVPLVEMVGGHPYLINIAFYHLYRGEVTLEKLLKEAPQPKGIYSAHLRSLLVMLQEKPQLAAALKLMLSAEESMPIDAIAAYNLESMGLIHLDGNLAKPSCRLYLLYFRDYLKKTHWIDARFPRLEPENRNLQHLSHKDELTQLASQHYFNQYLQTEWQQLAGQIPPLSLIFCDIDYFKFYNSARGNLAGDECLQRIANTIHDCVRYRANIVARYGGEEFAVILPQTDASTAVNIAEDIRASVKALAIAHHNSNIDCLPERVLTVSLGVASIIPSSQNYPTMLIMAADEALYQAKGQGRDRVSLYQGIMNPGNS